MKRIIDESQDPFKGVFVIIAFIGIFVYWFVQ